MIRHKPSASDCLPGTLRNRPLAPGNPWESLQSLQSELGARIRASSREPRGAPPLWSLEEWGGDKSTTSNRLRAQRARVLWCEVANCTLIIVRRAGEASVHTEGPALCGGPRHIPWAGGLLCFPFFFFSVCDICSVLVPPLIPNPTQLCRPPALPVQECPEHTAFLMCDKTEVSHGGMASEGLGISISLLGTKLRLWSSRIDISLKCQEDG